MKTVIASVILLALTVGFCLFSSHRTAKILQQLYEMTDALPEDIAEYRDDHHVWLEKIGAIEALWAESVPYFSYVCGYTALNRADEAVWLLYAAVGCGEYSDTVAARYQLLDALRRLRELEGISVSSVF